MKLSAKNRLETDRSYLASFQDLFKIIYYRMNPSEYYLLSLYAGIPTDYLSDRNYSIIEKKLNPRQTGVVNFDKWHQYCFFKGLNFPTPQVFGFIRGQRGILNEKPYTGENDEIFHLLDSHLGPIVIKPVGGGHGHGFDLIIDYSKREQTLTTKKGGKIHVSDFLEQAAKVSTGLLFQQHVKQHETLSELHPDSLNTLREPLQNLARAGQV